MVVLFCDEGACLLRPKEVGKEFDNVYFGAAPAAQTALSHRVLGAHRCVQTAGVRSEAASHPSSAVAQNRVNSAIP